MGDRRAVSGILRIRQIVGSASPALLGRGEALAIICKLTPARLLGKRFLDQDGVSAPRVKLHFLHPPPSVESDKRPLPAGKGPRKKSRFLSLDGIPLTGPVIGEADAEVETGSAADGNYLHRIVEHDGLLVGFKSAGSGLVNLRYPGISSHRIAEVGCVETRNVVLRDQDLKTKFPCTARYSLVAAGGRLAVVGSLVPTSNFYGKNYHDRQDC